MDISVKIEMDNYTTKIFPVSTKLDTIQNLKFSYKISKTPLTKVNLELVDEGGNPINDNIDVVNNDTGKIIKSLRSGKDGRTPIQLKSGEDYGITISEEGFLFQSEKLDISDNSEIDILKTVTLKKIAKCKNIVLNNVIFDVDKSTLRSMSINELTRVVKILNDNSSMKIELSGHTDNHGSAAHNMKISQARAKVVVDYLISKGIKANRLTYKGYGMTMPVT